MLFKQIFGDYGNLENRHFTTLHRIVLDLDKRDLYNYLQVCPREEINCSDSRGITALHWAAQRRRPDIVRLLLEHGADPNRCDKVGYSALHDAAQRGDSVGISYLLKYSAKFDAHTSIGNTPLLLTISSLLFGLRNSHLACAQRLIDAGANVNTQNTQGATPFLFASQYGSIAAVKLLLRNGAEINRSTNDGETSLTVAIQANQHGVSRILLAHGANSAHHTLAGRSLLHEAAEYGDEKTLRLLTSFQIRGVPSERKSSNSKTARDLAGKRDDVTRAWPLAFADLLASVDESTPEPAHESCGRFSLKPIGMTQQRFSELVRIMEDTLYAEVLRLQERMHGFVRLPVLVLSALCVLTIAIIWHTHGTVLG